MKPYNHTTETILKQLMWDYNISTFEVYQCFAGLTEKAGFYSAEALYVKALNNLSYTDLIKLFDIADLAKILTPQLVQKIRFPEQKLKYEILRRILHREPLPPSKWDNPAHTFPQYTILSNRWYGA